MKWFVAQNVYGLSLFICNCAHRTNIVSIQSGNVKWHNKIVKLGSPLNNWQSQFGTHDSSSTLWVLWRSAGLLAYVKADPCGIEHVTGLKLNMQKSSDADGLSSHPLVRLNDYNLNVHNPLLQDAITLSRTNGPAHLAYHVANPSFQRDDSAFYVLIEVDEKRRPSKMFYALSSEACANLGLELLLQDQKAFIDRGGCKK